jgi:hypothetical protein
VGGLDVARREMKFLETKLKRNFLAVFWLLGVMLAQAHDPYQGYTDVQLRFQQMEVKFNVGKFTAARLLFDNPDSKEPLAQFDEDNFNTYLPKLKKVGEKLFVVTSGGTNLVARAVDVQLNEEGDAVIFTVIYPRPPAGPLRIAATWVKLLHDEGYGTTLTVLDEARQQIVYDDNLNMEKMFLDLKSPPPSDAKPGAATGPQTVAPPPISNTSSTEAK